MSLQELNRIALITALIAVLARLSIPLPFSPVPITGQLIGIFLSALLLGGKNAFIALLVYLILGAVGMPIFSYGLGGPGVLFGPSGGYLWGFLPGVYFSGKLLENQRTPGFVRTAAAMLCRPGCTYPADTVQLSPVMGYNTAQALIAGVPPFLPTDPGKITFTAAAGARIRKSVSQAAILPSPRPGT